MKRRRALHHEATPITWTSPSQKSFPAHLLFLDALPPHGLLPSLFVLLFLPLALLLHPLEEELGVDVGLFEEVLETQEPLLLHQALQLGGCSRERGSELEEEREGRRRKEKEGRGRMERKGRKEGEKRKGRW